MAFVEYVPLTAFLQSLDTDVAVGTRNAFLSALGRKLVLAHIGGGPWLARAHKQQHHSRRSSLCAHASGPRSFILQV
jgi:hypothetical protein